MGDGQGRFPLEGATDSAPESARTGSSPALADGAILLYGFASPEAEGLTRAIDEIAVRSPFRHMLTPNGRSMSVAMTNCGAAGWVSDRNGYRYDSTDPDIGQPWPPMPDVFETVAWRAAAKAGFLDFAPDVCLINEYRPGARMSLHQDKDEWDFAQPIVSVSLGLPAVFLFGGLRRSDRPQRIRIESGDVFVWGGPARLTYHGIAPLADGYHPLTGNRRVNLTFRKAL